jgi:hypothetical protein
MTIAKLSAPIIAIGLLSLLAACNGSSGGTPNPNAPANIHQSYWLSRSNSLLALDGGTGTLSTTGISRQHLFSVSATVSDMTVAGLHFPYFAQGDLVIFGGILGFAAPRVSSTNVPGLYTFIHGLVQFGQLRLSSDGSFAWCEGAALADDNSCVAGGQARTGTLIVASPTTFELPGITGTFAFYTSASGVTVIFARSAQSINAIAFQTPRTPVLPSQSFSSPSRKTMVSFANGSISISGSANFAGTYSVALNSSGAIQFSQPKCPGGTCYGIYNQGLNLLYLPTVGGFMLR